MCRRDSLLGTVWCVKLNRFGHSSPAWGRGRDEREADSINPGPEVVCGPGLALLAWAAEVSADLPTANHEFAKDSSR